MADVKAPKTNMSNVEQSKNPMDSAKSYINNRMNKQYEKKGKSMKSKGYSSDAFTYSFKKNSKY